MTDYLADKLALARWGHPTVGHTLDELNAPGTLMTCAAVESKVVHRARNKPDTARIRFLLRGLSFLHCGDDIFDRVLDVQDTAPERTFRQTADSVPPPSGTADP